MILKKFAILGLLAITLGGCANLTALTSTITAATSTTVTPTEATVAANAYDGLEAGATGYLTYCAANKADVNCSASNRRSIIKYTRSGRQARNQVETYIQTSASIPSAIYNTLVVAVNGLKSSPAASYVGN